MITAPPRILAIAGSDSSGGAGIQADIKTITMLGGYAMTAITAVTAQNTLGVSAIELLPLDMVAAQIDACLADIGVDAVKIGMLGSPEIAAMVADRLEGLAGAKGLPVPIVFDPVMVATSGAVLADSATIAAFERLMRMASVVTPNLPELEVLTGGPVLVEGAALAVGAALADEEAIITAAIALAERIGSAVLAKGGHLPGERIIDILMNPDRRGAAFEDERIETRHTHGTGCTLSSALATMLGHGLLLEEAVRLARQFVRTALEAAPGFGAGAGPMGHQAVRDPGAGGAELPRFGGAEFNQLTLPAADYAKSIAFYRSLGLLQIVDSPAKGYARFECSGGSTLSIATGHGEPGGAAIYFEFADLAAAIGDLRRAGLTVPDPVSQPWLWQESWLEDPAGNRVCLYHAGAHRRFPPWRIDGQTC